jgi:hypothetical protein
LAPATTERLQHFLERLQDIGIRREEGEVKTPYQATLEYKAPSWKESRPERFTIFYLLLVRKKPVLAFSSKMLSQVVGLDIQQLESDLLQAGCTHHVGVKATPIRLFLSERNDQAIFDRLFEILRDLMEKHRV